MTISLSFTLVMVKRIFSLSLVILILGVRDVIGKAGTLAKDHGEVCNDPKCVKVADRVLASMDDSVNPCDNFYQYACGGWIKNHKIPKSKDEYSAIVELSENDDKLLKKVMPSLRHNDTETIRKVKDFYKSCLNQTQIDGLGAAPIQKFLKKIGSWDVHPSWKAEDWDFSSTLRQLHKEYPAEIFFTVDVDVDPKNRTQNIVTV